MEGKSKESLKKAIIICIVIFIFYTLFNLFLMMNSYSIWPPTNSDWRIQGIDNGDNIGAVSLRLDSDDNPHILYSSSSLEGNSLKYAYRDNDSWKYETPAITDEWEPIYGSLELDGNNIPHICYVFNGLIYTKLNGLAWENQIVDPNGERFSAIAIDSNNNPHIAYGTVGGLNYSRFNGNFWVTENIDNASDYISLDLDSNDYPHIVYEAGSDFKYAYWDGNSWIIKTIENDAWGPAIAIDSHNRPHISYAKDQKIYVTRRNGASWENDLVDSRKSGHYDGMTALALDESDDEYLSYICGCTLRFAKKFHGVWITEVLYSTGGKSPSSIDVDSSKSAHIGNNQDFRVNYIVNTEYDSDGDGVSDSNDFLPEFNNHVFNTGMPILVIFLLLFFYILISKNKTKKIDDESKESVLEDSEKIE